MLSEHPTIYSIDEARSLSMDGSRVVKLIEYYEKLSVIISSSAKIGLNSISVYKNEYHFDDTCFDMLIDGLQASGYNVRFVNDEIIIGWV